MDHSISDLNSLRRTHALNVTLSGLSWKLPENRQEPMMRFRNWKKKM